MHDRLKPRRTYVTPSADLVEEIIPSEAQVHDALVDSATGPLRRQVGLRYLHPAQWADEETNRATVVGLRASWVAAASGDKEHG